jgi:hypothetical protein
MWEFTIDSLMKVNIGFSDVWLYGASVIKGDDAFFRELPANGPQDKPGKNHMTLI